jgi:type I restriction enzyme S subunit
MVEYENYKRCTQIFGESFPSHWEIKPIYGIAHEKKISDCTDLKLLSVYLDLGVIPFSQKVEKRTNVTSLDLSKYQRVDPGDFVLNNQQAWRGSVGVSRYTGIVSPAYIVLELDGSNNSDFMNYMLRSHTMVDQYVINSKSVGSIQRNIHWISIKRTYVPIPPRAEQDQIVRFLDWKVSEINKLIGIRRKEIQELEELLLKVTNIYVTHGIRRSVQYQITGIDWAPEIPENWSLSKIRHHFGIKKRIAGSDGYDVFSVTQKGLKVRNIHLYEGQLAADYSGYQFVQEGEFAMNHMDLLTGGVGIADHLGVTSPDYRVFRLFDVEHCYAPYFLCVFQLCYRRHAFYRFGHGAANVGRWRLPADAFLNFEIPLPPYEEQVEIVRQIDTVQRKINFEVKELRKQIEDLEELKSAIVSDVVTGKVDVRNITVPHYEHVDDIVDDDSENNEETETDGEEA